jgi:hypothetical protein
MARKRTKAAPKLIEPPKHHAHIGRDARGQLCYLGHQADGSVQAGSGLTLVASIDVGRPFQLHVPSKGKSGLVIEGMSEDNAVPWSASMLVTGARHGWFGLRLVE